MADGGRAGLAAIFTGLGSLSYGELAGERMKLGLLIHDPEEEHDCFSDNTHNSHYYDALGIRNVYLGSYKRTDGIGGLGPQRLRPRACQVARGRHPHARRARRDDEAHGRHREAGRERRGLRPDDRRGQRGRATPCSTRRIEALIAQSKEFERDIAALELKSIQFEGSDSLDDPATVR